MKKIIYCCLLASAFFAACKKDKISASDNKAIISFVLPMPSPSYAESGVIGADTINVKVPAGVPLDNIIPLIQITGVSVTPDASQPQNFTRPIMYTVTAEDGSTRAYTVIVTPKTTTKNILDFRFKPADNPGLTADATGRFISDTSIVVNVPTTADVRALVPSVIHNGIAITPQSGQAFDFSSAVYYTVTAEDGSSKKYNVIVTANRRVFVGSANGYVYALDAGSGQVAWSFNGGRQMSSPIYYQGKIYVAAQGAAFYCLNAETGLMVWSAPYPDINFTTACLSDGKIFVGTNRTAPYTTALYAMDAATGTLQWNKPLSYIGYGGIATPTAADGYVVITEFNNGLSVLNANNGSTVWNYNPGITQANPLVKDGVVYAGGESSLVTAYSLATGAILWRNTSAIAPYSSPVILGDVLYQSGNLYMYALNKNDGSVIWAEQSWGGYLGIGDNTHSSAGAFSSAAISVADTALYAGASDNATYCLDLRTGAKKWYYPLSIEIKETSPNPVVAHGLVVVNREDNSLYAFSAKTGAIIWKFTATGAINTDPCMTDIDGNVFYTGTAGQ